jgi:hypothetical protein
MYIGEYISHSKYVISHNTYVIKSYSLTLLIQLIELRSTLQEAPAALVIIHAIRTFLNSSVRSHSNFRKEFSVTLKCRPFSFAKFIISNDQNTTSEFMITGVCSSSLLRLCVPPSLKGSPP